MMVTNNYIIIEKDSTYHHMTHNSQGTTNTSPVSENNVANLTKRKTLNTEAVICIIN